MTDMRTIPAGASGDGGLLGFLGEARRAVTPRIALPVLLLLVVLTGSNIVLLRNLPSEGEPLGLAASLAGLARVVGLLAFLVPLCRILAGSSRPPWKPDGAFFLFIPIVILSLAVGVALAFAFGMTSDPLLLALRTIAATLLLAPLGPWIVGVAAAVPLGLDPRRFLRDFGRWLPQLIFWSLLLAAPLAFAHSMIDMALIEGRIEYFWTATLADGLLSTILVVVTYALYAAAYRRVARG